MKNEELDKRELIEEDRTKDIKKTVAISGPGKRSLVALLDLAIMALFVLVMLVFVVQPLYKKHTNISEISNKQDDFKIASKLFYRNEEDNKIMTAEAENYISVSKEYFESYCVTGEKEIACKIVDKTFAEAVLMEEWFKDYYETDQNGELVYKQDQIDKKAEVEKNVYNYALTQFSKSDAFVKLTKITDKYFNMQFFICITTGVVIFYLILPLCLKNGKTLGKLMFGMSLTNNGGYKVTKVQIIVRFAAFYLINVILGLYITFFISVFVSFTCMVFSKTYSSAHDFCAATLVVDDKTSLIFDSRAKHLESIAKEEKTIQEEAAKRKFLQDIKQKKTLESDE